MSLNYFSPFRSCQRRFAPPTSCTADDFQSFWWDQIDMFLLQAVQKVPKLNKYRINDLIVLNEWKYTHEGNIESFKSKWVYLKINFFQWLFVWLSVNYSTLLVTAVPQWNALSAATRQSWLPCVCWEETWELLTISSVIKSLHFYLPWVAEWFSK